MDSWTPEAVRMLILGVGAPLVVFAGVCWVLVRCLPPLFDAWRAKWGKK